jgi:cytochrome o ubiquinol oxidase subunit I
LAPWHILLGRLTWDSLVFVEAWRNPTISEIIGGLAGGVAVLGAAFLFGLVTILGRWRYLWTVWLTSLDHKKIGIMYMVFAVIMLCRALIEAVLTRTQQAIAINNPGLVAPDHFAQLFSTHGTIMVFFVGMPLLTGLMNFAMPLQIGSRDVAFPYMNSISLWLTVGGGIMMMASLVVGKFSTGGRSGYPPYTELAFNGGVGPDYWIWAVSLSSLGAMMTGINFAVAIYKFWSPGMKWMRLPLFTWTSLCTAILMIFAMPPLTVATLLLAADRYLGMHFFTNDLGGDGDRDPILYGLASSFFYDGAKRRRQLVFRHRDDADRHPYRREDLRLDLDNVLGRGAVQHLNGIVNLTSCSRLFG